MVRVPESLKRKPLNRILLFIAAVDEAMACITGGEYTTTVVLPVSAASQLSDGSVTVYFAQHVMQLAAVTAVIVPPMVCGASFTASAVAVLLVTPLVATATTWPLKMELASNVGVKGRLADVMTFVNRPGMMNLVELVIVMVFFCTGELVAEPTR